MDYRVLFFPCGYGVNRAPTEQIIELTRALNNGYIITKQLHVGSGDILVLLNVSKVSPKKDRVIAKKILPVATEIKIASETGA